MSDTSETETKEKTEESLEATLLCHPNLDGLDTSLNTVLWCILESPSAVDETCVSASCDTMPDAMLQCIPECPSAVHGTHGSTGSRKPLMHWACHDGLSLALIETIHQLDPQSVSTARNPCREEEAREEELTWPILEALSGFVQLLGEI